MDKQIKILITGGTGFIGTYLIKKLSRSKTKVLSLSRKTKINNNNIIWIKSDLKLKIKDFNYIKSFKPEIIIHLAWENIPDFSKKMCKKNLDKTKFFFKKVLALTSVRKIIVSGSCFEYFKKSGNKKENNKINLNENFPRAKNNIYNFLKKTCKKKQTFAWFRIFYAYGPGQRKESLIPSLMKSFKNNKKVEIKSPLLSNDYIYVDDIVNVIIKATKIKFKSGVYNLGSGKYTKTVDIVKQIEKEKKSKLNLIYGNKNKKNIFFANMQKTMKTFQYYNFTDIKEGIKKTL